MTANKRRKKCERNASEIGLVCDAIFQAIYSIMNVILNCVFLFRPLSAGKPLNEYISHYETLSYDHRQTHASHSRAKRSVTKDPYVFLKFRAHNRPFHIRLKRDIVTFSDNLVVSGCRAPADVWQSCSYFKRLEFPLGTRSDSIVYFLSGWYTARRTALRRHVARLPRPSARRAAQPCIRFNNRRSFRGKNNHGLTCILCGEC